MVKKGLKGDAQKLALKRDAQKMGLKGDSQKWSRREGLFPTGKMLKKWA